MNRVRILLTALLVTMLSITFTQARTNTASDFGIKEFDAFHDVLHPLEHESLPKKDYEQIRNRASDLFHHGKAIVKLSVPKNLKQENIDPYKDELSKFDASLKNFAKAARNGSDAELVDTFSAVHDSFEMLAGLVRQK
jgi:hypothetical protein